MTIRILCMLCFFLLLPGPEKAYSREIPLPPEEEMQKSLKTLVSETSSEKVERFYYEDNPVKEVVTYKGVSADKPVKAVWEDRGLRYIDDLFSERYIFSRAWEFQESKVLARTLADGHFLQVLVVSRESRVILQEILLSDPELTIDDVSLMEDAASGGKLVIHIADKKKGCGNLFLADVNTGAPQLLGRFIETVSISPSRMLLAYMERHEDGKGEVVLLDVKKNKTIARKDVDNSRSGGFSWSLDENRLFAALVKNELGDLLIIDTRKGATEDVSLKASAIAPSPSGKALLWGTGGRFFEVIPVSGVPGSLVPASERQAATELHLASTATLKEQKKTSVVSTSSGSLAWAPSEGKVFFYDQGTVYGWSTDSKNEKAKAASAPDRVMSMPAHSLAVMADETFLLLQEQVLWKLKGLEGQEKIMDTIVAYTLNEGKTTIACLKVLEGQRILFLASTRNAGEADHHVWLAERGISVESYNGSPECHL